MAAYEERAATPAARGLAGAVPAPLALAAFAHPAFIPAVVRAGPKRCFGGLTQLLAVRREFRSGNVPGAVGRARSSRARFSAGCQRPCACQTG